MYSYFVWLLSHSIIMLRFIYVVEYISTIKSTICLHSHMLIVMWVVSISSLSQIDLRWTCLCESVQTMPSLLFGKYLGINRLNYMIGVCLTFLRICRFPKWMYHLRCHWKYIRVLVAQYCYYPLLITAFYLEVFITFTVNDIIEMVRFKYIILLIVFYLSYLGNDSSRRTYV